MFPPPGLPYASIGAFNFAAKDAARYGAIIGKGSPPAPNQGTALDVYIVNNIIVPRVNGVVVAQMTQVEIFDASQTGGCSGGGGFPCSTKVDILQKTGGGWVSISDSWPTQDRNDQLANADYLGVRISYSYTYLTAFFAVASPTINLNALSIQRIEPQQYGQRQSPAAPAWASAVHLARWMSALIPLSTGDFIDQDRRALRDWLGGRA